jgi:DNA (cytosine-5)-methyltransferase 1
MMVDGFDVTPTPYGVEPASTGCIRRVVRMSQEDWVAQPTAVGLFAGIGGIELGLGRAGFGTELLCEIDPAAQRVLEARFAEVPLVRDIRELRSLPAVDVVAAGFPCQDLSQAGRTAGIGGSRSGLVDEVFRLVSKRRGGPTWLLIENVSFMLHLDRGRAMRHLTNTLSDLGFAWAYRVVDTRAFGLPQRRQRVIMLASRVEDPRPVLLAAEAASNEQTDATNRACGFYWTEGLKGLGWAVDAVPTLKGGSTVGIPSPPAMWMPDDSISSPDLRDAERLQGFESDWTAPSVDDPRRKNGPRWKLVGNAVSVPVAEWAGRSLITHTDEYVGEDQLLQAGQPWPKAAWGKDHKVHAVNVSYWPEQHRYQHLETFLRYPVQRLSDRALLGFLSRASRSSLRFPEGLLDATRRQVRQLSAY